MLITPAILAHTEREFRDYLSFAHILPNGRWHIDVLDGSLHHATCWHDANVIGDIPDLPEIELHLMVQNPLEHIFAWQRAVPTLRRILLDADLPRVSELIEHVGAFSLDISLVLNPGILPDVCAPFLASCDEIVVMGVHPGMSGQNFIGDAVYATIDRARALFPLVDLAVDGGVHNDIIGTLATHGVTRAIASSALWKDPSPLHAHQTLQELGKVVL